MHGYRSTQRPPTDKPLASFASEGIVQRFIEVLEQMELATVGDLRFLTTADIPAIAAFAGVLVPAQKEELAHISREVEEWVVGNRIPWRGNWRSDDERNVNGLIGRHCAQSGLLGTLVLTSVVNEREIAATIFLPAMTSMLWSQEVATLPERLRQMLAGHSALQGVRMYVALFDLEGRQRTTIID